MQTFLKFRALLLLLGLACSLAWAQPADRLSGSSASVASTAVSHRHHDDADDEDADEDSDRHGSGNNIVSLGSDAHLLPGRSADSVVAIFASALSEGAVGDTVSIFGSTRVTGPASGDAVAIFGSTYVDSKVEGDAVAVLGNLELGPHAEVGGDVVTVGGNLVRDPQAIIHGHVQSVLMSASGARFEWLRNWARHCLLYGRPLAFAPDLGWAWAIALSLLALYALLSVLFPGAILRCLQTLQAHPGHSLLAALLGSLLTPLAIGVLCVTVIGLAAVPILVLAIIAAGFVGKAVMLAWLGQRCLAWRTERGGVAPVLLVLLGGAVALVLYVIPVAGFLVYKLLGFVGFGVVVLTFIQGIRGRSDEAVPGVSASVEAPMTTPESAASAIPSPEIAGPLDVASLPRAGFWIRMAALLIDCVLIGVLLNLVDHLAHLQILVLAAYGAIMWKTRGSTVGGIIFDLQIVRSDGRTMDWSTSIVRALGCLLSLVAAGIGFLWIGFDPGKQAWHDKIADTVVVRTTRKVSLV